MDQDESHAQESKVERRDRREGKKFGLIHLHIDRYERVSRKIFPQIKNCLFNRLRNMFLFFKHDVSSIWKNSSLIFLFSLKCTPICLPSTPQTESICQFGMVKPIEMQLDTEQQ